MDVGSQHLLIQADARRIPLADGSVQCCACSPPYFGLRDYQTGRWVGGDPECRHDPGGRGQVPQTKYQASASVVVAGGNRGAGNVCVWCGAERVDMQIGLEGSVEEYVAALVAVFREVKRVLHPTGVLWLNLGDSYNAYNGNRGASTSFQGNTEAALPSLPAGYGLTVKGLAHKQLLAVPWRVALALQADGWWLRSAPPWIKENPMPESVTDRPGTSHEYVFLLSKSADYFYDVDAVRKPANTSVPHQHWTERDHDQSMLANKQANGVKGRPVGVAGYSQPGQRNRRTGDWSFEAIEHAIACHRERADYLASMLESGGLLTDEDGMPSAFLVNPKPYPGAHFAVWPETLVSPMIRAGTSERGCCPACGSPWVRIVEKDRRATRPGETSKILQSAMHRDDIDPATNWRNSTLHYGNRDPLRHVTESRTTGWRPACVCGAPAGVEPGDFDLIGTPTGEIDEGYDATQTGCPRPYRPTGGNQNERPRAADEGTRPITRYERRKYAEQLRSAPADIRDAMRGEAGEEAFAHYRKPGDASGRPIAPELLERWIGRGWLTRVVLPTWEPLPPVPCRVLDPFGGSQTTVSVANALGRVGIGMDLSAEYLALGKQRVERPHAKVKRAAVATEHHPLFSDEPESTES